MTDSVNQVENGLRKMKLNDEKKRSVVKEPSTDSSLLTKSKNGSSSSNSTTKDEREMQQTIFDILRDVKDPEKPETLEELNVLSEDSISVSRLKGDQLLVHVEFTPTVPHCSLASLIGLTIRSKLKQCLPEVAKVDIKIKQGTHDTADEINKQINDKERIAAAMENPNLKALVHACTTDIDEGYH